MTLQVKSGVVPPPPGWAVWEGDTLVSGYDHPTLVKALTNYRLANNIPLGDVENDIATAICQRSISLCRETFDDTEALERDKKNARTPLEQVRLSAKLHAHNRGTGWKELEQKETATQRASICENCSLNRPFSELSGCSPCHDELQRQSIMLTQGQSTAKSLGWCNAVFADTRSMVWLPKEGLERQLSRVNETVGECWLRQLT